MRRYYGAVEKDGKQTVMIATITGVMEDGTKVYTECDANCELIDMDKQYVRTLRHGCQYFERL